MTNIGTLTINGGNILKLWFDIEQTRELTLVSPDSAVSYTEDDKTGQRFTTSTTGEQIRFNTLVNYSPNNEALTFSYSSDNPTEIDVREDGSIVFMVEPESTSSATITVTATSGLETISRYYDVTLTLSASNVVEVIEGAVEGSARKALSDPLVNATSGANPTTQQPIYSLQDHSAATYTRNNSFLLQATHSDALTCISPWNSRDANRRSGTAITPRHVVVASHYPLYAGDSIRFIASDNTVVTKTIVQADTVLNNGNNTDARLLLLDSDLPNSITPCKLFPSNYTTYLPAGNSTNPAELLPVLATDFEEKGITLSILGEASNSNTPQMLFSSSFISDDLSDFNERIISGDSGNPIFAVTNNELWLISTFWASNSGPFYGGLVSELNSKITELDTLQGDITGYTVTEGDLSSFNTY